MEDRERLEACARRVADERARKIADETARRLATKEARRHAQVMQRLALKAQAFEQSEGYLVARVDVGLDAMEIKLVKGKSQQRACCF